MLMWWLALAHAVPVELPMGHTLASLRVRGMGGTCVALAESATCQLVNPASVVIRRPEDDNAWGGDTTIQATALPVYQQVFGGEEPAAPEQRVKFQVGANLKMNRVGAGVHLRQDGLNGPDGVYLASQWATPTGVSGGSWALGASPLLLTWATPKNTAVGVGAMAGGVLAPAGTPWRFGLSGRTPVRTGSIDEVDWSSTRLPARGALGVGYMVGLENRSRDTWPDKVRVNDDDSYVQFLGEVELTGRSTDARGVASDATAQQTVVVRGGVEADVLQQMLRLRAGAYNEPQRFDESGALPHLTAGLAVHLFTWLQGLRWRAGACIDWSPGEPSIGVGLETW